MKFSLTVAAVLVALFGCSNARNVTLQCNDSISGNPVPDVRVVLTTVHRGNPLLSGQQGITESFQTDAQGVTPAIHASADHVFFFWKSGYQPARMRLRDGS